MRILIVGDSGFIGQQLFLHLSHMGHQVSGCSRSRCISPTQVFCDMSFNTKRWQEVLGKTDLVINCIGIFSNGPSAREQFQQVHHIGPKALFKACQAKQVKVIQISALGAELEKPCCEFLVSKKLADNFLIQSSLDYKIFYPGIVIGTGGKSTQQLALLAKFPIIPLVFPKEYNIPIITLDKFVSEIARCIDNWLEYPLQTQLYYRNDIKTLLKALSNESNIRQWRIIEIPQSLTEQLFKHIPNFQIGVFSRHSIKMLDAFNNDKFYPNSGQTFNQLSFIPDEIFSVIVNQRYWRYFFILILSFIWCWSGLVSLINLDTSITLINKLGMEGPSELILIFAGAALDLLLGILIWWSKLRIKVLYVQSLVILIYSLILATTLPEFLLHPFAPIAKNFPILIINFYLITSIRK